MTINWIQRFLGSRKHIDWVPTHRHRKGGEYRVLHQGINEADRQDVTIYDDIDGTVWVRSTREFKDGRFTPI